MAVGVVVEGIRLVNEQHLAHTPTDERRGALSCRADVLAYQIARLLELNLAVGEVVQTLEDASVDLGNRRLARAWIAQEDSIERDRERRRAVELPVIVGLREGDDLLDRLLDAVEANHLLKLVECSAEVGHVVPFRTRPDDVDDFQRG